MKLTKIALGVALAAGTVAAQADSIWFPFVVTSDQVTTIVSVIHHGAVVAGYDQNGAVATSGKNGFLHWMLAKKLSPVTNDGTCSEVNYYLPTSAADVQSADLRGLISNPEDYGVLFNDPSYNNDWRAVMPSGLTFDMAAGLTTRGYLVVHDVAPNTDNDKLSGVAMNYDYGSGAAWGYRAEPINDGAGAPWVDHAFVATGTQVHVMPPEEVLTRFFITPTLIATPAATYDSTHASFGVISAAVEMRTSTGAMYNRDEGLVSGTLSAEVVCTGVADVHELVDPTSWSKVKDTGGWGYVVAKAGTLGTPGTGAVIYQLDVGGVAQGLSGKLNGKPVKGIFNNAFPIL